MSAVRDRKPIGVVIAGLGGTGLFHLERLSLRPEFRVAAVYDVDANRAALGEPFAAECFGRWEHLLERSNWQLLWLAVPSPARPRYVLEALRAGKHVVVEHPLCLSDQQLAEIRKALGPHPERLSVLSLREPDRDFCQARKAVHDGQLGPLCSAAYTLWTFLAGDESRLPVPIGQPPVLLAEPLVKTLARALDQLVQLVPRRPVRLQAFSPQMPTAAGVQKADRPLDQLKLVLEFDGPQLAEIDIHLSSLVTLETGWVLSGKQAGYRDGRRYQMADDGEIFSLPVECEAVEWEHRYDAVARWVRGAGPPVDSFEHAAEVAQLLFAAVRSLIQGPQKLEGISKGCC